MLPYSTSGADQLKYLTMASVSAACHEGVNPYLGKAGNVPSQWQGKQMQAILELKQLSSLQRH